MVFTAGSGSGTFDELAPANAADVKPSDRIRTRTDFILAPNEPMNVALKKAPVSLWPVRGRKASPVLAPSVLSAQRQRDPIIMESRPAKRRRAIGAGEHINAFAIDMGSVGPNALGDQYATLHTFK